MVTIFCVVFFQLTAMSLSTEMSLVSIVVLSRLYITKNNCSLLRFEHCIFVISVNVIKFYMYVMYPQVQEHVTSSFK